MGAVDRDDGVAARVGVGADLVAVGVVGHALLDAQAALALGQVGGKGLGQGDKAKLSGVTKGRCPSDATIRDQGRARRASYQNWRSFETIRVALSG